MYNLVLKEKCYNNISSLEKRLLGHVQKRYAQEWITLHKKS